MSEAVVNLTNICKGFGRAPNRLEVLRGVSMQLAAGEMVALVGPSGSGKSTLLQIAGLLDQADGGEMIIAGEKVERQNDDQRTRLRGEAIGFVYQFHHLLPEFSALENVVLPQMVLGKDEGAAKKQAQALLEMVGLGARLKHRPAELSGGEQQRVAIARALANQPKVLIADEPTGNLDQQNSQMVFDVLRATCANQNVAILMATHNLDLARQLSRVIHISDGAIA
jgi:lipoprotein-releasing system ATP-binding protein